MDTPPTLVLSCEVEKKRSFSTPIWLDLHKMLLIFLIFCSFMRESERISMQLVFNR